MTTKPRILVTSAAGRTGAVAVLELLRMGFPVRAFVRRDDVRSEALRKAGAEIFVGDLFDLSDLRSALVDVQRAYVYVFVRSARDRALWHARWAMG